MIDIYKKILMKSHLLKDNFSDSMINKLCLRVKEKKLVPDESLFSQGDLSQSLIFLLSGQIELFISNACKQPPFFIL
jgi:CRP-like cAMP-binding protein